MFSESEQVASTETELPGVRTMWKGRRIVPLNQTLNNVAVAAHRTEEIT